MISVTRSNSVIIRCDANSNIGFGHFFRCLALAEYIVNDYEVTFLMSQASERIENFLDERFTIKLIYFKDIIEEQKSLNKYLRRSDICILDGYQFTLSYQQKVKSLVSKLIVIDDLVQELGEPDVIINHGCGVSQNSYKGQTKSKVYLGLDYLLIRKEFYNAESSIFENKNSNEIFVCLGGGDGNNDDTIRCCRYLLENKSNIVVNLLRFSNGNSQLFEKIQNDFPGRLSIYHNINAAQIVALIKRSYFAVCSASSISLEVCAVKLPLSIILTAPNQSNNYKGLVDAGAAVGLGSKDNLTSKYLLELIDRYRNNQEDIDNICLNQKKLIDGNAPSRIREIFTKLVYE